MALDFAALAKAERKSMRAARVAASSSGAAMVSTAPGAVVALPAIAWPTFTLAPRPSLQLEEYRVGGLRSVFYIPDFLTSAEEADALRQVYAVPEGHARWERLRARRLQMWGGDPSRTEREPLPPWLGTLARALEEAGAGAAANHVLVNEYRPGEGILPHRDGPLYEPFVVTISLGSDALLTFAPYLQPSEIGVADGSDALQLVLRRGSAVIFREDAYEAYLHTIAAVRHETVGDKVPECHAAASGFRMGDTITRETRVSLTFRTVRAPADTT